VSLSRALLPPLAAFLAARVFLCVVSASTSRPPWEPGSWCGPDSAHYLSIARHGYELFPCTPDDPPPGHCGNAGWLPGYPWVLRPLIAAGVPPRWAAVYVSAAFSLATLVVLWTASLSSWRQGGALALLAAAFFPGQVYQHGAFPLAQFTLLAFLCLMAALRDRWFLAGLAGLGAALTYSTGWLLAPVLAAWGIATSSDPPAVRIRNVGLAAALTLGGFLSVLLLHWWQLGAWNAFFLVQGAYGHSPANPVTTWWLAVREVFSPWLGVQEGPHLQTLLVTVYVLVVLAVPRRPWRAATSLLALYTLAFWLLPLALGSGVSLYRSEATLLPGILLAEDLPRPVLAVVTVAMVLVAWPMAVLFFRLLLV
jgi:hypothetical protein